MVTEQRQAHIEQCVMDKVGRQVIRALRGKKREQRQEERGQREAVEYLRQLVSQQRQLDK